MDSDSEEADSNKTINFFKNPILKKNIEKALKDIKSDPDSKPIKKPPVKPIKSIRFGILGPDEIRAISTCKLTKSNIQEPYRETVYDERMGPVDTKGICSTCSQPIRICPGHFGYIDLATPIINPQFIKSIVTILNCICLNCSNIRISEPEIKIELEISNISDVPQEKIVELCSKISQCNLCELPVPSIIAQESKIYKVFNDKHDKKKSMISTDELLSILKKISDKDLIIMGFPVNYRNCKKHNMIEEKIPSFRPEFLILSRLPVLPTISRPPNFEGGMKNNDDLTSSYVEIIKNNQKIYETDNEKDREDRITCLEGYISSFIDNTDETTKQTSGKPIKSVKERLSGKDALIRGKIMGKRVDTSARTVITADTTLDIDQVGVPYEICDKCTKPELVTSRNIERLTDLLENDKITMLKRDSKIYMIMKFIKELQFGDIVYRHLQKDDIVVMNRQPTLHRGGMMGHRVVPMPGKTLRLNLAVTSSYGADLNNVLSLVFTKLKYESGN